MEYNEAALLAYISAGGKITKHKRKEFSITAKYRKDKQLLALKALRSSLPPTAAADIEQIDKAINIRIEVLKASY